VPKAAEKPPVDDLLKGILSKIMGPGVRLIDSAIETAAAITSALGERSLLRDGTGEGSRQFYVTDSPEKFVRVGERFLGSSISLIQKIELESEV
jgi:glutamate racemase